jgi:hypothetical protein
MNRWEDNVRIYLRKIRWEVMEWIYLAQDRYQWWAFMNLIIKFRVSEKAENVFNT